MTSKIREKGFQAQYGIALSRQDAVAAIASIVAALFEIFVGFYNSKGFFLVSLRVIKN